MLSTVLVVYFVCMVLSFWGGCNPLNPPPPPPRSATGMARLAWQNCHGLPGIELRMIIMYIKPQLRLSLNYHVSTCWFSLYRADSIILFFMPDFSATSTCLLSAHSTQNENTIATASSYFANELHIIVYISLSYTRIENLFSVMIFKLLSQVNKYIEYSCNKYSDLIGQLEVHYFTCTMVVTFWPIRLQHRRCM